MKKVDKTGYRPVLRIFLFCLMLCFLTAVPIRCGAEEWYDEEWEDSEEEDWEDSEEENWEEQISEEYYLPIQTNDIPGWPAADAVEAGSAVVMDMDTGAVLLSKNADEVRYPASITKIMTALVVLENVDNLEETMVCGDEVFDLEDNASNVGLQPEEKLTVRQALYALMLESANDAGNSLAMHVGGSIEGFAQLMNDKAASLGCTHTHFANPHGLHNDDHYVCAMDMALIARAAYANDTFREITGTTLSSMGKTNIVEEERYFVNHHKMLHSESDYYADWCTGGKTGYTSKAWCTLVTYGEKNGLRLVCVAMHELNMDKTYRDTRQMMNYGFDNFYKINATDGFLSPTFYDILNLKYPNAGTVVYESDLLKQETVHLVKEGIATIPAGGEASDLGIEGDPGSAGAFFYTWNGWRVGSGQLSFTPFPTGISFPYQQKRDMETLLRNSLERRQERELMQTAQAAWSSISSFTTSGYESVKDYVENNRMTAILIGAFILVVLLILIVILILRCTKESRIARKRRLEEFERMRREDEIDQMSATQIEQELREAMEQERLKKEREEQRRREELLEEEKLRETERILEEIQRENNG